MKKYICLSGVIFFTLVFAFLFSNSSLAAGCNLYGLYSTCTLLEATESININLTFISNVINRTGTEFTLKDSTGKILLNDLGGPIMKLSLNTTGLAYGTGDNAMLYKKVLSISGSNKVNFPIFKSYPLDAIYLNINTLVHGKLIVKTDAASPNYNIIIGGQTFNDPAQYPTLGTFRLSADSVEDLDVDQVGLFVAGGDKTIDSLYFYNGPTLLGSVPGNINPKIYFNDGYFTIPANSYKLITVKAKMRPVDGVNVRNNEIVGVTLSDVRTTGLATGFTVIPSDRPFANSMRIFKTRPYFAKDAFSPSNYLRGGSKTLLAIFDVTADSGEDVEFNYANRSFINFQIDGRVLDFVSNSSNPSLTFEDENGNLLCTGSFPLIERDPVFSKSISCVFNYNSLFIPAGMTQKIYIYGDTTQFEDSNDSIRLYLRHNSDDIGWYAQGGYSGDSYDHGDIIFRGDIYANILCTGGCGVGMTPSGQITENTTINQDENTSINFIKQQIASISDALAKLMEQMKNLVNP